MRQALVAGCVIFAFLLLGTTIDAAAPSVSTAPLLITNTANPLVAPGLSLTSADQVRISWIEDGSIKVISPGVRWNTSVAPDQAAKLENTSLAFTAGDYLAWSASSPGTRLIYAQRLEELNPSARLSAPADAVFTVDHFGTIHAAWAEATKLYYANSRSVTRTYELSAPASDLIISVDISGTAFLAWGQVNVTPENNGIYLLQVKELAAPTRIAASGVHPQIQTGAKIHAAFAVSDTLLYVNSDDWQHTYTVTTGIEQDAPFCLALGEDDTAHLAWYQNDTIQAAFSTDWSLTRQKLVSAEHVNHLKLAIDGRGEAHFAYSMLNASGQADIYYFSPPSTILQVALSPELAGEYITASTQLHAVTNLADSDVLKMSFYLTIDTPESTNTYVPLGIDSDGGDGWNATLRTPGITPQQVRACVLATATSGAQARACSGVFTLVPQDWPDVWLDSSINFDGEPIVFAYITPNAAQSQIDVYAQPATCLTPESLCPANSQVKYLGRYTLAQSGGGRVTRQRLVLNTNMLSDGLYYLSAALVSEQAVTSTFDTPIRVHHLNPPKVEVLPTSSTYAVGEMLKVQARVKEGQSSVTHIDYYLVHTYEPTNIDDLDTLSRGDIWLGTARPLDNWSIRVPVNSSWLGDSWQIKAIAYDEMSLYTIAYSEHSLSIVNSGYPHLTFIQLEADQTLRGQVTTRVTPSLALSDQDYINLYISKDSSSWTVLGAFTQSGDEWTCKWNTRAWPNGHYTLMATVHLADASFGKPSLVDIYIDNTPLGYTFTSPLAGATVHGEVTLDISSSQSISMPSNVHFILQDSQRGYYDLGEAPNRDGHYSIVWNSRLVLDGIYTITASITEAGGRYIQLEKMVRVSNTAPTIHFIGNDFTRLHNGSIQVCWQASGTAQTTVRLEYSPDNGVRWLQLAANLPASGCYDWDSSTTPDSSQGRLRAIAASGVLETKVTSNVLLVNNVAEAPVLTVLAPANETIHGQTVRVAWQSWNPDAENLKIDIAYRVPNGVWISLGSNLEANGEFIWDVSELSRMSCELRITARAASGLSSTSYRDIELIPSEPLTIRLFSPNGGEQLSDEALILWNIPAAKEKQALVDVYVSDNAGQSWLPLAEGLQDTSYYQWQLSFLPPGDQYRVKVVARTLSAQAEAVSAATFTIGNPPKPTLRLVRPNSGNALFGLQRVEWLVTSGSGCARTASLEIRPLGQTIWDPLVQGIPDDGFYIWNTSLLPDGLYELRLVITDNTDANLEALVKVELLNHDNHPPQVRLLSTGLVAGSSLLPIRWEALDIDNDALTATIEISSALTNEWTEIAKVDAARGVYWWRPDSTALDGRLRLVIADGTSETSSEVALSAYQYEPTLAWTDEDAARETGQLKWAAQNTLGQNRAVDIYLNSTNNLSRRSLVQETMGTSYTIDMKTLEPGVLYLAQLETVTARAREMLPAISLLVPPLPFQEPKLQVQLPQTPVTWTQSHEITWETDDPLGRTLSIQIYLSDNGGSSWETLSRDAATAGSYSLDTTQFANGLYLVKITADNKQVSTSRISAPIYINNPGNNRPIVSLLMPYDSVWSGTKTLRWITAHNDKDTTLASLSYSTDDGRSWQPIAVALPDSGSYVLNTNMLPNAARVWLRVLVTDGEYTNQDVIDTPIRIANYANPVIHLTIPSQDINDTEDLILSWQAVSALARPLEVTLDYSTNDGASWTELAGGLSASGTYPLNSQLTSSSSQVLVRATASTKWGKGIDTLMVAVPSSLDAAFTPFEP
ncbi:MAG: hypothetical protein LLG44_03625 [Chloroflexi bacterium]|nr:hypothetical protein [Chloroflexota bacterium]